MFCVGLAAVTALSYRDWKNGLPIALILLTSFYICGEAFPIYHTRITNESIIIKNIHFITLLACVISALTSKFYDKQLTQLFNSKYISALLGIIFCLPVILIFRDNLPIEFEMSMIHGRLMRTYNELNLERLFFFYPAIIIPMGVLGIWYYLTNLKMSMEFKFFLIICSVVFGFYLFTITNSPQMYWAYRRYLYVLMPLIFLGFSYFLKHHEHKNSSIILSVILLVFTINLQINSKQIFRTGMPKSEMQGMDKSVNKILNKHKDMTSGTILFHEPKLRYQISSIVSMGSMIPIPTQSPKIIKTMILSGKPVYYATSTPEHNIQIEPSSTSEEFIKYVRLGEQYTEIPKSLQKKTYQLYIHRFN